MHFHGEIVATFVLEGVCPVCLLMSAEASAGPSAQPENVTQAVAQLTVRQSNACVESCIVCALCACLCLQKPLLDQVPNLKVVMEHITTADAAHFVAGAPANVAASVTPQHMLLNRNALFAVSEGCPGKHIHLTRHFAKELACSDVV